jgi:hypothetical protein
MIAIHLGVGIDRKTAGAVIAQISKGDLAGSAVVTADDVVNNLVIDPVAIALSSLVCSIVSVLIGLRRELREASAKSKWTADRFEAALRDELLKLGVVSFRIVELRNFSNLQDGGSCQVMVEDSASGTVQAFAIRSSGAGYELSKVA